MAKTIKTERLRWVLPIANKEVKLVDAAKVCPYGQRSLERWLAAYKEGGEEALEPKSTRPKTNPRETPIRIKEQIIELRQDKKQCAKKIQWDLQEVGVEIHYQTVQKIIKNEGLTKKYRTRKISCSYIKIPLKKGELVEIDVKYVPDRIKGRRYFQFTAIDVATRWRYLQAYDEATTFHAIAFLKELNRVADFKTQSVKTDNGSCFTNRYTGYYKSDLPFPRPHAFDMACKKNNITHYLIDPGKPQQNSFVERSHREDQEKFYEQLTFLSFEELRFKLRLWNMRYNDTKHCSLGGKTPNQMLEIIN